MNIYHPRTFARRMLLLLVALVAVAVGASAPAHATMGALVPAQQAPPTVELRFAAAPIRWGQETSLVLSYTNAESTAVSSVEWTLSWNDGYVEYLGTTLAKPGDTSAVGGKAVVFVDVLPGETRTATIRLRVKPSAPSAVPVSGSVTVRTGTGAGTFLLNPATLQVDARQFIFVPVAEIAPELPQSIPQLSLSVPRVKPGNEVRLYIRATNPAGAAVTSINMSLDDWDFRYLRYDDIIVTTPFDTYDGDGEFIQFGNVRPGERREAYMRLYVTAPPANTSVKFGGTYTVSTDTSQVSGRFNEVTLEIER